MEGMLDEVADGELKNKGNISPDWANPSFDPGWKHSIPYQWGSTSFMVDTAVYGGDLKPTGLSEQLIDIAADAADDADAVRRNPETRLRNGVAWPIWLNYTDEALAEHNLGAVFENFDPPAELGLSADQLGAFVPPDTPERRLLWSRSFSSMREQLDKTIGARLVVVGRGIGSSGAVRMFWYCAVIMSRSSLNAVTMEL